jgi:hypothetical protein
VARHLPAPAPFGIVGNVYLGKNRLEGPHHALGGPVIAAEFSGDVVQGDAVETGHRHLSNAQKICGFGVGHVEFLRINNQLIELHMVTVFATFIWNNRIVNESLCQKGSE